MIKAQDNRPTFASSTGGSYSVSTMYPQVFNSSGNVLRLLPPLVMSSEETDLLIEKIAELVSEFG